MKYPGALLLACLLLTGCSERTGSFESSSGNEELATAEVTTVTTAVTTEKVSVQTGTAPVQKSSDTVKAVAYWTDEGVSVGMSLKKGLLP